MRYTRTTGRHVHNHPPLFVVHGPGLIRKGDASWRTFNGLAFRFRDALHWFELRSPRDHWSRQTKPGSTRTFNFSRGDGR